MEMKKALVLFGLLGIFASGFGAEPSGGLKSVPQPSMKLLMTGAKAEGIEEGPRAALEKRSTELKESGKNGPLNVILLLVDELYRSDVSAYLENQDEFPVHGLLETCPAVTGQSVPNSCDCDEKLGSSIASLISWAQRVNMSTSGLYEISTSLSDPRARLVYRQRRETPWLLQIEPSPDSDKLKIASKLKDTFFRSLVNGLSTVQLREPPVVYRSNVAELTTSILKELGLKQNQRSHLTIVRTAVDELGNVLELLKRYISPSNTLTVVMNSCPQYRSNLVPFFASGFGSERLSQVVNLKRLYDLPSAIREVIDQHKIVGEGNFKPAMIFMTDEPIAPEARIVRGISYEDHQRSKRDETVPDICDPEKLKPFELKEIIACVAEACKSGNSTPNLCKKMQDKQKEWEEKDKKQKAEADKNGQEAITQSTMMIVTVVTATVTYALKF